jgi:hypothetical protein
MSESSQDEHIEHTPTAKVRKSRLIACGLLYGILCALLLSFSAGLTQILHSISKGQLQGPFEEPVGGDFICFYLAGKIAREAPAELYNFSVMRSYIEAMLAGLPIPAPNLPFAYPPYVAVGFALLSMFNFQTAFLLWSALSLSCAGVSLYLLCSATHCRRQEIITFVLWIAAFAPFTVYTLAGGQTSGVGMLILAGFVWASLKRRPFLAGLILGLGAYKPPVFLVLGLLSVLRRERRIIGGALCSIGTLLVIGVATLGLAPTLAFFEQATRYVYGAQVTTTGLTLPVHQGVGLLSLLHRISPVPGLAWLLHGGLALCLISLAQRIHKRLDSQSSSQRMLSLGFDISVSLFLSVQMIRYDLAMLIVPGVLFASAALSTPARGPTVALVLGLLLFYLEPLLPSDTPSTPGWPVLPAAFTIWIFACLILVKLLAGKSTDSDTSRK